MLGFKVCTCDVRTMMYVDVVASLLWADHKNSRYQDVQSFLKEYSKSRVVEEWYGDDKSGKTEP